jgi:hypothetical protein
MSTLTEGANARWSSSDFQLRDKLGGGNFGVTFEGLRLTVGGVRSAMSAFVGQQRGTVGRQRLRRHPPLHALPFPILAATRLA